MKLPRDASGKDVVKILCKNGWRCHKQRGSHMLLVNASGQILQVPMHDALKPGTLESIIDKSGMSRNDFIAKL
jgi:predicted RNA binding protein YcfA (HicA-like mRNA interferase family)